ncbi:MAG: leucine-rich repeat protein [Lachnospiraceae bacterium]|nr:leucine-rich repeat protein [Lachnospiraceae bacterium]
MSTGKITWTPIAADEGKTYTITLTARRGVESVSKNVEIFAGYADKVYETKTVNLPVKEDAEVETWGLSDRGGRYNRNYLTVMRGNIGNPSEQHPLGSLNNGEMGEKGQTADGTNLTADNMSNFEYKMSMLKFDLAELEDASEILLLTEAKLSLMYLSYRSDNNGRYGSEGMEENLRVVKAPSNDWSEGSGIAGGATANGNELSWSKWIAMNEGITYGDAEHPIVKSDVYKLISPSSNNASNAAGFSVKAENQILINVTDFVRETLKEDAVDGKKYISLAMTNENGSQHNFISKEGATYYNDVKDGKMPQAAPALIVKYVVKHEDAVEPKIEGSDSMALAAGYEATSSDSFSVVGVRDAEITLASGSNTAGGKITWDAEDRKFEIAKGIAVGAYELSLETTVGGQTVPKKFTLYVRNSLTAPKFTNPAKDVDGTAVVSAYADAPVSFAVKAEMDALGENIASISADSEQLGALEGATFDPATGAFRWIPSSSVLGTETSKDYTIAFTATGSNGISAEHTVTIRVSRAAEMVEDPNYIGVSNDGYFKTWNNEKVEGTRENDGYIWLYSDDIDIENDGKMGVNGTPYDSKIGILKFDLTGLREKKFLSADLILTYIAAVGSEQSTNADDISLNVAAIPGYDWAFEWNDGNNHTGSHLCWAQWNNWRYANSFTVKDDDVKSFHTKIEPGTFSTNALIRAESFSRINGTKIRVDISKFVEEAVSANRTELTLMISTAETGSGTDTFFISKEGLTVYQNPNNVELMAPSIALKTGYAEGVGIEGPDSISLVEGYADTYTDSFTVPSYDLGAPSITALSPDGENKDANFSWDTDNSRVLIKSGLTVKANADSTEYKAKMKHNGLEKEITVTVNANKYDELADLKTEFEKNLKDGTTVDNYTSESVANYKYILGALTDTLNATNIITAAQYNKAVDLTNTFDKSKLQELTADYRDEQIAKYEAKYIKEVYTAETWSAYETALNNANLSDGYTEEQLITALKALETAKNALVVNGDEASGSPEGKLYKLIEQANPILDNAVIYDESAIEELEAAVAKAEKRIAAKDTSNDDITTVTEELKGKINISPNPAKRELQTQINAAIDGLPKVNDGSYTTASWNTYQTALETARGHMSDSDLTEAGVPAIVAPLKTAVLGLTTLTKYRTDEIARVTQGGVDEDSYYYVEEDLAAYQSALDDVNDAVTEDEITESIKVLDTAFQKLNANKRERKSKDELKALIDSIKQADYTPSSWTAAGIAAKLATANTVYAKDGATDKEILDAYGALEAAVNELTAVSAEWKALQDSIADVGKLTRSDWTTDSWSNLQDKLRAAQDLTADASDADIAAAKRDLKQAQEDLVPYVAPSTDKTKEELNTLVEGVEDRINGADGADKIDSTDYPEEKFKELTDAIAAANALPADATTKEINDAYAAIETALGNLSPITVSDVSALVAKVNIESLTETEYEPTSFQALKDALAEAAKTVEGEEGADTPKVAYNALLKAFKELKQASGGNGGETGDNGNGGAKPDPSALTAGATVNDDADTAAAGSKTDYVVADAQARTVILTKGKDEATVIVPETIKVGGKDCTVIGIGDKAFIGAKALKKLTIGNNVTSIGKQSFANCKKLANVIIGTGVTTIGAKAFSGCKKLGKMTISAKNLKTVKSAAFKGTKKNVKVKLKGMTKKQKTKIKKLLTKKGKMKSTKIK